MFKEPNKQESSIGVPNRPTEEILHEFQELQIKFEMQSEELRRVRILIEEFSDRYVDLYEFSPVCYITLTKIGRITKINLTAATLLGEDSKKLLRRRFSNYVLPEDQGQWNRCFEHLLKHGGNKSCELRIRRMDGTLFNGYMDCRLIKFGDNEPTLHITLLDITEKKRIEAARCLFETLIFKLTSREREVLVLALSGTSNKDISIRLQINQRTVENYRSRIHRKTGIASLLELAQHASRAGVPLDKIANFSNAVTL
jgi:PAS domain S-box-containing protein